MTFLIPVPPAIEATNRQQRSSLRTFVPGPGLDERGLQVERTAGSGGAGRGVHDLDDVDRVIDARHRPLAAGETLHQVLDAEQMVRAGGTFVRNSVRCPPFTGNEL